MSSLFKKLKAKVPTDVEELKKQMFELKADYEALQEKSKEQQKEIDAFKLQQQSNESQVAHSNEFWAMVRAKCRSDKEYIKELVKKGEIKMNECDDNGMTFLLNVAKRGAYELTQLAINLGSDINHVDKDGKDALQHARDGAWSHIEQLLLFCKLNANIGHKIEDIAYRINKQKGITENVLLQLAKYDDTTAKFFKDTVCDLMAGIIKNKRSFSDDLLALCWKIECDENKDVLSGALWKELSTVCIQIMENGSIRDWRWLKTFVCSSTVWLTQIQQNSSDSKPQFLFYELLKFADNQSSKELAILKRDFDKIADENQANWQQLINLSVDTKEEKVRQDAVPNGITSKFTKQDMIVASSATFDSIKFYDYNEYLSELILTAEMNDDGFQRSIQKIFNIDQRTHVGRIETNENDEKQSHHNRDDGMVVYSRGPVKKISRARSKATSDYGNERFPTSACVLDLNRCALTFNDIGTMLKAIQMFENKVKFYQSDSIIGIVRDKNDFKQFVDHPQYADIKKNVLIKGKVHNIIGEVQFLLQRMKEFKAISHDLYSIQREKDFMDHTVSAILPLLISEERQIFVAANKGDKNALCDLMVLNNKTTEHLMLIEPESKESILLNICALNNVEAFKFLRSAIPETFIFVDRLFAINRYNQCSIGAAIQRGNTIILKDILSIKEVKERITQDKKWLYRILFDAFVRSANELVIDMCLQALEVTDDALAEMLKFKYKETEKFPKGAYTYDKYTMTGSIPFGHGDYDYVDRLNKIRGLVGDVAFVESIFDVGSVNMNVIGSVIWTNGVDLMKHLMAIEGVKDRCLETKTLWQLVFIMCRKDNESMIGYLVNTLELNEEKLQALQTYRPHDAIKKLLESLK
eukprot:657754_1